MKTKIIGLTGGIGSGKTTIANYFADLGVPVYIADTEAKKILYFPEVVQQISEVFGEEVLTDNIPDRKKLASVVFKKPEKLEQLNAIIHPRVRQHFTDWTDQHKDEKFVIKEAAILFESGSFKDCDKVILVTAPKETRIKRVMKRDGVSEKEVLERMKNQWSEEKKKKLSDFIIENIDLEVAKNQVNKIYKTIHTL
ncbi:dephospho-CoA kinase [Flavobacterium suaedae]|uniref:Dephospho-CoA kinase n=1 Tax=Flavobacterium suaedae TaxID=1767027 RepID=A0ABQ1JJX0_9FLAO|nr:dephospho-CoA kinase [Flavobacterium suaedae]GGB68363.1 dephospho-CoA kinase [Flavobacterium suaedae]